MKAWTDYPFTFLGDEPFKLAPIREIEVLSYDSNRYCQINVEGHTAEIKAGFIYEQPGRYPNSSAVHLSRLETLRKIK